MTAAAYQKIGLTGGIGSGKTTAAQRFGELGASVYHADEVSRHALDVGGECYARVVDAFGDSVLRTDGSIDRRALGEVVFADESKRILLNQIIHPYVIKTLFSRAEEELSAKGNGIAVFEVPLLFESGMSEKMDYNIVVSASEENRVRRVMERDLLTREQVLSRIRAQMPEEQKLLLADSVIYNNGTADELIAQVDELYQRLLAGGTRD